mmetsp:Transcript_8608/g.15560  ORF Transcript_8608/g.15560 Transcript_8608/m.15560 type:complete len:208 (+) Transcript_8608:631-1254(+)
MGGALGVQKVEEALLAVGITRGVGTPLVRVVNDERVTALDIMERICEGPVIPSDTEDMLEEELRDEAARLGAATAGDHVGLFEGGHSVPGTAKVAVPVGCGPTARLQGVRIEKITIHHNKGVLCGVHRRLDAVQLACDFHPSWHSGHSSPGKRDVVLAVLLPRAEIALGVAGRPARRRGYRGSGRIGPVMQGSEPLQDRFFTCFAKW